MVKTIIFNRLSLACACFMLSTPAWAQLQRVEPAFWWKGMKNPEIQLLLYGKNIAKQQVTLDGITVKETTKVENPNYVFVTVNTNEVKGDSFTIKVKDGNKPLSSYTYKLMERTSGSAQRSSYSSKDVIYLAMPDRFANGNPGNDTQKGLPDQINRRDPNGRHGGDLRGVINHLDYLQSFGVTALWLTPVNEDNEQKTTYHGYAQTDLYKIDPRYGTNTEYVELSKELKKRNMLLIQDYVTNHWGLSHWLIQDLPTKDWIHQFPGGEGKYGFKRSNYRITSQFDRNAARVDKEQALNGWFDTTMPDLNQSNPLVLKYLTQNAIWWIEYAGLDGLRVDTYPYNDKAAMATWSKAITTEYPNLNIVGEAWMYSPAHISYWQKDSKVAEIDGYNSNLPSVMDFHLFTDLPQALREEDGWDRGMMRLYNDFGNDFLYPDINNLLVFFENHDTDRFNETFKGDLKAYQLAMTLIATVRGIPQIYYGSEIGMRGEKAKGDGDIRQDFPGGWAGDANNAFSESGRTAEQKAFYEFTKKILNWRKTQPAVHSGKTTHYAPENGVYVYFRYNDKDKVMVILNNGPAQDLPLKRFAENLQNVRSGREVISGKTIPVSTDAVLHLEAKTPVIIELK